MKKKLNEFKVNGKTYVYDAEIAKKQREWEEQKHKEVMRFDPLADIRHLMKSKSK